MTGYPPYIPNKNENMVTWMDNFQATVDANPMAFGLSDADIAAIDAAIEALDAAWAPMTSSSTKTKAVVAAFNAQRDATMQVVRPYATVISQSQAITSENKSAAGVTVRKTTRTPVPAPSTKPLLTLISMIVGAITMQYRDATTPTQKGKPFGVVGAEVWINIGTAFATDPSQCSYYGLMSKTPFALAYDTGDSGKKITIFARWATKGCLASGGAAQTGPWSDPVQLNLA